MTQIKIVRPNHTIAESLSKGQVSVNAQVAVYKGLPNPTLMSLLSNGTISLAQLSSGVTLGAFGGD